MESTFASLAVAFYFLFFAEIFQGSVEGAASRPLFSVILLLYWWSFLVLPILDEFLR